MVVSFGVCRAYQPKAGHGRPPKGLETMFRVQLLQQWFNLSDPAVEEALYGSLAVRAFVGIDVGRDAAPSSTKNVGKARDPEMHQTRKGNQWHLDILPHTLLAPAG